MARTFGHRRHSMRFWTPVDRGALKAKAREQRRRIDTQIVRRALNGDDTVPSRTRNAECEDRWYHD